VRDYIGVLDRDKSNRRFAKALMASTAIHALVAGALAMASPWQGPTSAGPRRSSDAVIWVAGVEDATDFPYWDEPERPLDEPEPDEPVLVEEPLPTVAPTRSEPRLDPAPVADSDHVWELLRDRTFARPAPPPEDPAHATELASAPTPAPEPEATAGPSTEEPLLLHRPAPRYPRNAQRMGWQGTVLCRLTVLPDGSVERVAVLASCGHTILDDAAVAALLRWRFRPGVGRGSAAPWVTRHRVTFRLPEG